ncbi:MAG TPA: biotin--[acetyl-CoA-carboxylase] ligase [Acetobacteraceae bacterium]|nr:biotin--[acetyl-CoA-carboxylase] ligase [Acetobacteraceae bacterium]
MIAFDVRLHERIGSTNDEARRLALEGAASGTVVCADEQTTGRGRQARHWFSPPGNLYFSLLLRPDVPSARLPELAFVSALAVADTADALLPPSIRASLKWPNDVLVKGAKVAGILLEQVGDALVVGVGLNILHAPERASYQVTTIAACGGLATVDGARAILLDRMARQLQTWEEDGFAPIRAAWLVRAHPVGAALRVTLEGRSLSGHFAGLDQDGALLLDMPEGRRRVVAGDVVV